jgi:hypothetical protein
MSLYALRLCCKASLVFLIRLSCGVQALAQTEALAKQQTCLTDILSALKIARADLNIEETDLLDFMLNTGFILSASNDTVATTDASLSSLGSAMSKLISEALAERQARCRLEYLLWAEQQRVMKLENGYSESNKAGLEAVKECSLLSTQVQEIWDGQGQVCSIFGPFYFTAGLSCSYFNPLFFL